MVSRPDCRLRTNLLNCALYVTQYTNIARAAGCAAPFVLLTWIAMSIAYLGPFGSAPAFAKARTETLIVQTASVGGTHRFEVEVARSDEQKALGLMFRTSLPNGTGMLFPYGEPQEVTMWMSNTYISLDMLFIRSDGIIHRIEANTEPFSEEIISSNGPVTAVLELSAGTAAKLGIKAGDKVQHTIFQQ